MKKYKDIFEWSIRILFIAFAIEVIICNYPFWKTMNYEPIEIPAYCFVYGPSVIPQEDGSLLLEEDENVLQYDIDILREMELENLSVIAICTDGDETWDTYDGKTYAHLTSEMSELTVVLTDGEKNVILPKKRIGSVHGREDIIRFPAGIHPRMLTIQIKGLKGTEIHLKSLRLNVPQPFEIKMGRVLVIYIFLLFCFLFRPQSILWEYKTLTEGGQLKKEFTIISVIVFVLMAIIIWMLIQQNPVYLQGDAGFTPYRELAHAFAGGHCYLEEEPGTELLTMQDPYDPVARLTSGISFKLDYALYQGKYYVYFGVLPCIVFYLPLYLAFGFDVPGYAVVYLLMVLLFIGIWRLILRLAQRFWESISAAVFIILWLLGSAVLSIPAVVSDPNAYYIPMLSAVVCYVYSLGFFLQVGGTKGTSEKKYSCLALGALFLAMIAGCRPQMIFGGIALIPVLVPILFEKRDGKVHIDFKGLLSCVLPVVPIAAGLMYYNKIRFGSVFDFGAAYNLTFAYAYRMKFHWEAVGAGIYYYLFRPVKVSGTAPYLIMTQYDWSNPALLANHISTGGLFVLYPVLISALALFRKDRTTVGRDRGIYIWMGRIWFFLIFIMAAFTAVMGGLMDRYRMDISIFAALFLIISVYDLYQAYCMKWDLEYAETKENSDRKKRMIRQWAVRIVIVCVTAWTVVISALSYLEEGVWWIYEANPEWYSAIADAIEFWR